MSTSSARSPRTQPELLDAARRGDEAAFRRLVEPHRPQLHAHCYRMLGSLHDADDALQDTLLRAWRGLPRFEGRSAPASWLYKIATNACLDLIARRPTRVLPIDYGPRLERGEPSPDPLSEATWIEPYPEDLLSLAEDRAAPEARYEQREAVELAFIAALQHLPAQQRAVLILREVLGFTAREAAASLGTTIASVNSALQRARRTIDTRLPRTSQQATVRALGDGALSDLVRRFVEAFEQGDVGAITALFAEDATFSMPPYPGWYRGREAIAGSWLIPDGPRPLLRFVEQRANGQPAVAAYRLDRQAGEYRPIALDVLTLAGHRIAAVTAFRSPDVLRRFGLPDRLTA